MVFIDLRGFTAFAESSEPEYVIRVLRQYQTEMSNTSCHTRVPWNAFLAMG